MKKRWCSTLWPTEALAAQQAGMTLEDFAAFVRGALFLDQPDPVAAWGGLRAFQDRLIARLRDARELRLEAEGTDLTLGVAGRTWVNSDGRRNMPSGEVFTGPHEHSANGRVRFTVRSAPARRRRRRRRARAARRRGRVAPAPSVGDDYLQRALATDDGARYLGEIGIGTNFGIDAPDGDDPLRREDRRHRPPRARALLSRDRRQEPSPRCTGTSSATCAPAGG